MSYALQDRFADVVRASYGTEATTGHLDGCDDCRALADAQFEDWLAAATVLSEALHELPDPQAARFLGLSAAAEIRDKGLEVMRKVVSLTAAQYSQDTCADPPADGVAAAFAKLSAFCVAFEQGAHS